MAKDLEEVNKYVKTCITIFVALMALTIVTVAVSYLKLPTPAAIALALAVALIKGSLVAAVFMHLISEKKIIYMSLWLTVFFFMVCILVPVMTSLNPIEHIVRIIH